MPLVMLDTNIASAVMRSPEGPLWDRLETFAPGDVCMSVVTSAELRFGIERVGSVRLLRQFEMLLDVFAILPFAVPSDEAYARIRTDLERAGTPIGANDLLIAAHALALDLTLVTANIREFSRVPNLRVENWLD